MNDDSTKGNHYAAFVTLLSKQYVTRLGIAAQLVNCLVNSYHQSEQGCPVPGIAPAAGSENDALAEIRRIAQLTPEQIHQYLLENRD